MPAPDNLFLESWVALGRDERGTLLEVHPLDFAFMPRSKTHEIKEYDAERRANAARGPVDFAIASPRSEHEIHEIANRAAWERLCDTRQVPGGAYGVVEVWIENRLMLEVLTPEVQAQYAKTISRIPQVIPPIA